MNNTPNSKKKSKTKTSTPKASRSMGQYSHLMRSLSKSPMKKDKNTAKATPKREKSNGEPRANNEGLRTPPSPGVWLGAAQTTAIVEGSPESRNEISTPRRLDSVSIGTLQHGDDELSDTKLRQLYYVMSAKVDGLTEEVKKIPALEEKVATLEAKNAALQNENVDLKQCMTGFKKDLAVMKTIVNKGEVVKPVEQVLIESFQAKYRKLRSKQFATLQKIGTFLQEENNWQETIDSEDEGIDGFKLTDLTKLLIPGLSLIKEERNKLCHAVSTGYRTDALQSILKDLKGVSSRTLKSEADRNRFEGVLEWVIVGAIAFESPSPEKQTQE